MRRDRETRTVVAVVLCSAPKVLVRAARESDRKSERAEGAAERLMIRTGLGSSVARTRQVGAHTERQRHSVARTTKQGEVNVHSGGCGA